MKNILINFSIPTVFPRPLTVNQALDFTKTEWIKSFECQRGIALKRLRLPARRIHRLRLAVVLFQ